MKYGVWCQVWGGPTGPRSAWLKQNDVRFETPDFDEAAARAEKLTEAKRNHPHAHFFYELRLITQANGEH
jgi:hypothetical protein